MGMDYEDVTLEYLLEQISAKTRIKFSYSPDLVPVKQRLSYSCRNKPVVQILSDIFVTTGIRYSIVNDYIVVAIGSCPPAIGQPARIAYHKRYGEGFINQ